MLKCLAGICGGAAPTAAVAKTESNKKMLLREISGISHKSSHETIRSRSMRKINSEPPTPTPLRRGFTHTIREDRALAKLVADVMQDYTWKGVGVDNITVEDKSGKGGSKTYKVTAKGYTPEVVALHSRSEEVVSDPLSEPRMEAAQKLFSQHGIAPRRIVEGGDWFLEEWEGTGQPEFKSDDEKYAQFGKFLVRVHSLPTEWYDEWREQLVAAHPYLSDCTKGSQVWWFAARAKRFSDEMPADCRSLFLSEFNAPKTAAGQRVVTIHGDLHQGNMITIAGGDLKCIDFEFSCVSAAATDLSYCIGWMSQGWQEKVPDDINRKKRIFLKSYLEAMGDPYEPADVENLLLDAELAVLCHHFGPLSPFVAMADAEDWKGTFQVCKGIVDKSRGKISDAFEYVEDDEDKIKFAAMESFLTREHILELGILELFNKFNVIESQSTGRLCLVKRDSPYRCIFEHAQNLRGNDWLPLTLASHPGMAIVAGPAGGPVDGLVAAGGGSLFGEPLGTGSVAHVLYVRLDEEGFIHTSESDPHRVFDVDEWNVVLGTPLGIFNDGRSLDPPITSCEGQKFKINEDGTISPAMGEQLVLGAAKVLMENPMTSGRLLLVPKDSLHRCIFEYADKLRNSEERVPLTLTSHPNMAIAKGPKQGPFKHVGYDVFYEELGTGPTSEAIAVKRDDTFLCETADGGARRVLDIAGWIIQGGSPLGIFNDGPSFKPPVNEAEGQAFRVNEDGTISPTESDALVLGAAKVLYEFK